jgi:H+/Cl- antiporter ClcA
MTGRTLNGRRALLVDLGATAIVASIAAMSIGRIVAWLRWVLAWPSAEDAWWAAIPALGAVLALLVTYRAKVSSATADDYAYGLLNGRINTDAAPPRAAALGLGVGVGAPLGLEGPMVYFGGVMGAVAARWARRPERWCVLAGATAASAMVIEAPIAAALFAGEIARRGLPRRNDLVPVSIGALAAWLALRVTGRRGGLLGRASSLDWGRAAIGAVTIGAVAGVVGWVVLHAIVAAKHRHYRLFVRLLIVEITLLTAIPIGWIATGDGIFLGPGQRLLTWAAGASQPAVLAATCVFAVLVIAMVASELVGGLFVPLLSLGGLVGLLVGRGWLPDVPLVVCVGIGSCAMLAAGYGAPLTAVALAFTLFGWSSVALMSVIAIVLADVTSGRRSVSIHQVWPHVRS